MEFSRLFFTCFTLCVALFVLVVLFASPSHEKMRTFMCIKYSHHRPCPCRVTFSPSLLPNLHSLPSPRRSALSWGFPLNCATFPRDRKATQPPSNHVGGARWRRLCLSSRWRLLTPCSNKMSYPTSHPHNTLAPHKTSLALPPPSRPHPCTS